MKMPANDDRERFQSEADKYAAYLETPEGRLRLDLPFANLQEFLPLRPSQSSLCALDLGCGTGANGLRLARLGFQVTLLDSSQAMLDIAKHAAQEAGISDKIELKHGDADLLARLFPGGTFDVILCHNVLEFVADHGAVLRAAARALRGSSAILSILVRNQAGEVLKAAIQAGDLAVAEHNLAAHWANEALYGGRVRLFTPDATRATLKAASLTVIAERGVRVMSDYLSPRVSLSVEYERIFALERKLGCRPEFAAVSRYTQWLAHRAGPVVKNGV
jgi:S-adenosylmethionine-dependent methyltransferase